MNEARAFQAAAPNPPFNLAEIWPFPINAGAAMPYANGDHHFPINDPMLLDHRTNHRSGSARKRREDDESAKGVSTSGNGLVFLLKFIFNFLLHCCGNYCSVH